MGRGLKFKRSMRAHDEQLVTHGGNGVHEFFQPDNQDQGVKVKVTLNPYYERTTPAAKNIINPPPHIHYKQHESFTVIQGTLIFTIGGQEIKRTKKDGIMTITPGQRHTFRADPDCQENIIVYVTTTPKDGVDESFLRNAHSYLDDCYKYDCSVSPFQLMTFLWSADMCIAPLAIPNTWLNTWLGWFLTFLGGKIIGEYVLGFKSSYEEYYDPKSAKKA